MVSPRVVTAQLVAEEIEPVNKDLTINLGGDGRLLIKGGSGKMVVSIDALGNAEFAGLITGQTTPATQSATLDDLPNNNTQTASTSALPVVDSIEEILEVVKRTVFRSPVEFIGSIIFRNHLTVDKDTAGIAIVSKWTTGVSIRFERPYENTPIITISFILPHASDSAFLTEGSRAAVSEVTQDGFSIVLDQPSPRDLMYYWIALSVEHPIPTIGKNLDLMIAGESTESASIPLADETTDATPSGTLTPTPMAGGP